MCVKDIEQAKGASLDEINADQRLGALGKLHNLAVSFSRDPQKLQRFKTISSGLRLRDIIMHRTRIVQIT